MELNQLRSFVYVVNEKSFSKAAQMLHFSQPTISSHIGALEKELDTSLIVRTTKRFQVTSAGKCLYDYAKRMLSLEQGVKLELRKEKCSQLSIGTSSVPGTCFLPDLLFAFNERYPEVRYRIVEAGSLDILKGMNEGFYDVGFVGTKGNNQFTYVPLFCDEIVIVAPANDYFTDLLKNEHVLQRILEEPFITRSKDSGTHTEAQAFLSAMNISFNELHIAAEVNDAEMMLRFVEAGIGISVVSRLTVERYDQAENLIIFPLSEIGFTRNIYLAYSKESYCPDLLERFIRFAVRFAANQHREDGAK